MAEPKISQQVLEDFMATVAKNPNVDRQQLLQVFPEFGNDMKMLDAAFDYRATRLENPNADIATVNSKFPEFFGIPEPAQAQPAAAGGVSGGSLLSDQEELARQNAIQGVTDDPYRPHVEQKQPNAFQTLYKGLGAGVINTANGLLGFLNRANSGRLAYDPVTLQQMAKQGKSPEEIEQAAQSTLARLDSAETERYNAWKAKADQLAAEAKPDGGEKSFTDYLNPQSDDFDLRKALQLGLGTAAESLPYTLSALNPVATASMIMSMSEQNYRQSLIDNPDMSDGQRLASAAGNAAIEMAVEHIGNPFKVFKAGKLTAPNATKWIKQVVKESKDNIYKGILRVLGFGAKEAGKEGGEEVITTAGQDLYNTLLDWKDTNGLGLRSQWERAKQNNPNLTPGQFALDKAKGLTNDFIGGALSGMMMSGPSTGVGIVQNAKYYSKNGGSEASRTQAQQQLAVLQQLATEFDVTEEEVAQAIVDYQAEKQLTPKQQALINRGEEIITNLQNAQSATQATELQEPVQETTPLSPTAAEYARVVNEVTQSVRERTHGNGYIYLVAMQGKEGLLGNIVGEVVPVIDESNPEQLRIENDDVVTVKWSDGTVTQERARDLDLTGAPMMAQQAVDIEVENQMYAYTQQRIQNGEQPVLMRNGEGILEGFFPTEGGLLEDQNGVQYTPEQLAEQGWQETKPVLFVNDTQQIAALDNGDGTYTQVDALGNPIAEPMSAEAFREQGFAMVPLVEEQPKSQAPVEAPVVEQAPEVQQPEVQEPAAPVVPNIETMSAADYAGAAVEYMGSREYVDEYLDGEIKKVQQQLDVANRKKVGNVTDMADFKTKKDAIEAEKKALQTRLDKLTEAREKAKSYLTIAEREARAKAEAERRAAEEAARIAREQAAAAEAARLEQERIDRELKKGVPDFSEDNDRDARNRGFHVVNGQVIHRQEPLQPLATGKAVTVQFAKGQNGAAEAHHVLIPVSMAQPSHINGQRNPAFFISEAQPKDRRDQVSKVTSDMMAQNIHPDEIVEGATAYVGAPVLNGRGEAVQGNNRLDALIKMYQSHPESVAKYKQYLIDNAAALGYTETDIETIRNNDVIDVRMLDNVTDEQAIQLGQKKATDLETGGVQLIDPQVTANQLGDRIQRFSEILLRSEDDEATLADLTLRNGRPALEFLQKLGIISDAQMQSAFDSRGNLTAEAKAALQGVLKQVLFQNAESDNLPIMFDDIPVTAQKAILQTIVRDLQSPEESRLVPDIQEAIGALYRALHQSAEVKNGRNEQEIRAAMRSWALQMQFPSDFDAENFVPSEIFSNFALELATLFKYGKQTEVAKTLNAYYDAVQGTTGGLFGDTPAIPYKEAIKQIFGIDYKSVDEARREKHRKELTDYLNTISDEAHPFELYGNDNVIEILKGLGANDVILARAQELIDSGESILGIKGKGGRLLLNSDSLADKEAARSKYVHERQHLLTTQEQKENVLKAASVDELKLIVKVFTNGSDFYDRAGEDEIADEFISYSMEEAYAVESDEELESILRAAGANDELINIIKSINNEQRENDERLGQSERLGNARRHTDVDTNSEGHREQGGRDQGTESGVLEPKGARLDTRGELGGRTGGENQGGTEGAGLSEVGSEGVSGEEAGGAGDNAGIAGENQGSSGVGQERGLGEVTATPTEDNAHLSDNESAFVAPQMPIDTQTNAQKQSKAPSDEEQQQAAQYLNEALQEVISKSGDKLPKNITIDENTIEDIPDSVEMTARLLIDGKPSDFSVTIFDQSLGARGGFDPVNMVKFYPREELDKWDWDLADRLAEEFNKTRTQESGLATVMDESDAVYFFNMQAALDFAEKARQEIAPSDNRETSETRATEEAGQEIKSVRSKKTPSSKKSKDTLVEQTPKNADKIEDVGEKIGGARKDIVQETVDRINVNGDTFAKIFPKFDYHKLIANGLEPRLAAGLKYVCEHAKKSYKKRKKRFGENNALEATRFMANYAKGYLLGDTSLDFTSEGWVFTAYGKRRYEFGIKLWESLREAMGDTMFDVDLSGYDCDVIQSEEERKVEAEEKGRTYRPSSSIYYRRNADGESVEFTPRYAINTPKGDKLFTAEEYDQAVQYFQDQVTSAINYQAANPFELAIYRKRGSDDCCVHAKIGGKWVELTPWGKEYGLKYRDEHRAELQAMAQRKAEELKEQRKNTRPEAKVELRLTRREDGTYGNQFQVKLGKEYVPIKDDIMPITDSYNYLREHREELTAKAQELLNAYLDEQEANRGWKPQLNIGGLRNRVGTDWRNGADVTAERFRTEFGFRGVEFGNYVTQKERQRLLNECFDALHDMAEILGVSPRALSLNGQLGFAIGARGGAGAKAHYEPGKNVINLTKKNGWGALAHEWWHAMDYYFGKREKERPATSGIFRDDVRKQMQDAFAAVMKAINGSEYLKRSQNLDAKTNKRYYAEDTELGARAFEDYIAKQLIERGQVNDFLSHHTSEEDWNGDISNYPYPIEKDGVALADAFQAFFDTVEERTDEATGNQIMFSISGNTRARYAEEMENGSTPSRGKTIDEYLQENGIDTSIPAMTEAQYLASVGLDFMGYSEPALHKGQPKTLRQRKKRTETYHDSMVDFDQRREDAKKEYQQKLAKGDIRIPTKIERLMETAKGHPDNQSVQSARRLLEKRGIDWESGTVNAETGSPMFSISDRKQAQFDLVQANNPMTDDVHTGIRSVEDIHTLEETLNDERLLVTEPDWEEEDIRMAIEDNRVTIYSSYPIENGVFVTPSRMTAEDYAGGDGPVYEKTVSPDKVAWIASDEGQYADVDETEDGILFSYTPASDKTITPSVREEMESIKNEAVNNGTFMQAPNGNPTNLDERQWLQVRTRAFKRWFGDWQNDPQNASKILDENGEPRVVYHRTNNKFTQFDPDRAREQSGWPTADFGFYFSNVNERGHYGRKSMPVFLNIRNPREIDVDYYADFDYNYKHADPEEMRKDNDGLQINIGRLILDEKATKVFVAPNPNQIKSATDNNGSFSEENDDIRFSISNQNNDIFYSNAERAVEGIKQEKATPEQWRAMIEKAGGLKAGEDKWIGLSDWLAQQRPTVTPQANETRSQFVERAAAENKRFTLSKQDLLDYIREHKIQIEETHYQEEVLNGRDVLNLRDEIYDRAYDLMSDARERYYDIDNEEESMQEAYEDAMGELKADYGEDVEYYYNIEISGDSFSIVRTGTDRDFYEFALNYYHDANDEEDTDTDKEYSPINSTRLRYTTEGLENKREIALTVPTIDSWGRGDDIHFGDAGEGRAVAWVRFGDATATERDEDLTRKGAALRDFEEEMQDKYNSAGDELLAMLSPEEREQYDKLNSDVEKSRREYKVLVIDEIQSKRHQEGREHGYIEKSADKAMTDYTNMLYRKYGAQFNVKMSDEERMEYRRLQREREFERQDNLSRPTAAPFEKNWHELAMKRILRFAAENGYDKVAWTTGDQQAARYNIGNHVDGIDANPFRAGVTPDIDYDGTQILIYTDGATLEMDVDKDGNVVKGYESASMEYEGKNISDIVGKEIARKLLTGEEVKLRGEDFRIGGEGMRGFYDDILPRFMQKYGKKWGVQVGEVTMPQLEEGYQTMHAIDINDAMRESVLEGQPMFSISGRGVNGTIKPQEGETRSQYIARVAETVKNMTPRNTTIDDAIRFSITVNHNSPYLLKRADGSFVDPETGERLGFDHRFMSAGEGNQAHGYGSYFSVRDLRKYAKNAHSILYKGEDWRSFEDDIIRNALGWVYTVVDNNRRIGHNLTKDNLLRALKQEETRLAGYTDPAIVRHLKNLQNAEEWVKENLDDISIDNRHHYTVSIPDNDGTNYIEEREPMSDRVRKAIMDGLIADGYTMEDKDNGEFGWYEFNKGDFLEDPDNQISLLKEDETYKDFIHDNFHGYDSKMIARVSKYLSDAGVVGIHYFGNLDGECYVIFNPDDAVITDHIRFSVTGAQNEDEQIRFSVVTSRKKIAELEAGEKIKVYRAAQVIDGKLYPPMAAKQQGQLVKPIELGRWEQAEEHPELAKDGKFKLDKANGSSVVPAAYNPYFHTSRSPLNDQFSSAYDRPNLVTLEVEVPVSELTSGYKAEGAKDAVGETSWHSGAVSGKLAKAGEPRKVILSRWDKPLRIVPDAEVAEKIAGMLAGKDIAIPYNVVTPSLRAELEKQGVTISDQPSGTVKKPKEEIRFSVNLTPGQTPEYKKWLEDNPEPHWVDAYPHDPTKEFTISVDGESYSAYNNRLHKWQAEQKKVLNEIADKIGFEWRRKPVKKEEVDDSLEAQQLSEKWQYATPILSRSETVTKALVRQANNNYNIMQSALKKVTADLKGIRAALRMQSDYDRKVVDALLNLYNTLLQENGVWAQYMPDTTRRIATQIVHAIGKQDITEEVNTIMDHMVHAQAKAAQRQWDKLRQTPIDKINISGVVMQGKVALEGQHALKAMNDALQANMTIEQIEEQINQLMDMEDNATDESLKTQYKGQWIGLTIAAQHLERLQHLQEERQQLDLELQSARSNKALKPAARQQLVDNIKQAMRDNYIEQAEAYTRSTQDLSEYVNTQEGRAKDFIRRQDANRDKIRSYAQRDLEGLATNPNRNRTRGNVARSIWDAFASPIRDLQSLLRLTGLHAPDGEGYLYNHFMRNWMDGADMERTGIVAASKTLDEKIAELTHGKYKTWEEAARKINDASHNMFGITMLNGVDGKDMPVTEEIPLNAGNALYIYAVNKMNDGRMKLNGMNITEEDVQALADKVREQFGQEILDVVDWVQSEFFSQLRNRYNPTHEALFGAPMDAIENYFPLRINANARQQNEDLSEPDTDAARLLAGTSTGAIKRRTRNSLPLDVRNADFFQEVIRHISQMERWNAFAQWNRDANILFSDINFRNRIKGMKGTIYGEGDKLYNYMKDAFRVAIGTYKPNADGFSKEILNAAKGVTSAKINFRIFTALKQIASFPAFFTYMQDGVFVGSYLRNWLKPHETMKWAKENLPNFEKRVSKRDMGDMRLMQRSTDWQWNKRILEWSSKYGMFFNVFFDTLTCATGARAVYDSHLADYLKKGYSEEDARNRARQDAEQAFNTSQQSSEGAFMAPIQMDRNAVTAALTVFRTSPMQYTRNFFFHVRGLLRKIGDGKREEQIAFRMGQYKNDGLNDEQARKAAEKDYNKSIRADVTGVVVYGALLGILWRLVGSFPYLFFGDDDDKKKQIVMDAVTGGAFVQPITGLIGGSYIESALDGNGLISSMFAPELPFTQDAKRAEQYLQNNKYAEFASQALSVLMQSGTGFDPLTASDMVSRIVTTLDSEEELDAATQALRVSQALLSIPQSQYEQMLIDKVVSGKTDEDAALEDYIRYQKIHTAPLTWWLRGEESDEKAEENAEKRFNKLLTERDKIKNPEDYEE